MLKFFQTEPHTQNEGGEL